ncbi:MAG: HD domain-containing protein [Patescibacteria group bacterium]
MKRILNPGIELYLKDVILPDLDNGRPDWDRLHTVAVVHYVRQIIKSLEKPQIDETVLIISAYLHDWGYTSLFRKGKPVSYDRVQKAKKLHAVLGKEKAAGLLKKAVFSKLTETQKKRIVHLVGIHDELHRLKAQDELILMEADTLGALDSDFVKPTYDYDSHKKYIRELKKSRLPLFVTPYSKTQARVLLKKRMLFLLRF